MVVDIESNFLKAERAIGVDNLRGADAWLPWDVGGGCY